MTPPSQASLPIRIREGSSDALEELYRSAGARLYALAWRLTLNCADAEDIVHDVFVGLPGALQTYRERGRFDAWLKRLLVRTALMRRRSDGRRTTRDLAFAAEMTRSQRGQEEDLSPGEVERWLALLPEKLRTVVVLREIEGMTHAEIARTLGISQAASRVRLVRGLERLRRALGNEP